MRPILFFIVIVFTITGCKDASDSTSSNTVTKNEQAIVIGNVELLKEALVLNGNKGRWYYKDKPYTGYSLKYYPNGVLEEKLGFFNGRREGVAKRWTKNKKLQLESYYKNNKLDGVYKTWWENGELSGQSFYENGVKQGEEKQWFPDGQMFKLRNFADGKEHGFQKAWLANGKLYVNYEAKNGRIFGMRRASSCVRLEDEVVIRKKIVL
ncbi:MULTISPECIES: toxin-antitoxin system YwqK family antitoxin [unclassified Olleya]|jgi:antitoxin component YwqK of YwqJK toxin-antitoxin module|uniref:toxin-antitoxin system YwqK family antitoxin n=1 Tax=unclassified Olleya TaxID=2615019 RepID=UPI0011A2A19F|nr:toxin-antitoxin system YwqK family antitoxin [Olleya sp. Hel_I_94]TVZ47023.1 antitoxin component YwqK of YwqJK toxin-antitoxin module [Olleya sp. Hel_I_94]